MNVEVVQEAVAPVATPTAPPPAHINSLEALLALSVSELEALSDSQLTTILAPLFPITRPSAERSAFIAQRAVKDRLSKAMANINALTEIGL